MDIEKLIERLKSQRGPLFEHLYAQEKQDMDDAATAITNLLIENQALRNAANGLKDRAEKAEAELKRYVSGPSY